MQPNLHTAHMLNRVLDCVTHQAEWPKQYNRVAMTIKHLWQSWHSWVTPSDILMDNAVNWTKLTFGDAENNDELLANRPTDFLRFSLTSL